MKSLEAIKHSLSNPSTQIEVLEEAGITSFSDKILESGYSSILPTQLDVFQINLGKMCNQVCKHCHVDAGPDRKEIMTKEVLQLCLKAIKNSAVSTVDLTGGAPEMHPDFRWFVEELSALGVHVIVRCNLTIILANKKYYDLPHFYKKHNVEVVSSLPHFSSRRTDAQRGEGVFDKSIKALQMLNEVGYGKLDTGLILNLVYNPSGAFLPDDQSLLENEFKKRLMSDYSIEFNQLFAITNIPISRFLEYLVRSENYNEYMDKLLEAYNPGAVAGVMCRNTISVSWDGYLYDCDFNQMLDLKLPENIGRHISDFDQGKLLKREIIINNHCYGCTAGAGSSCGGQTV